MFVRFCRYYLKARAFHGTLVQDEEAEVWPTITDNKISNFMPFSLSLSLQQIFRESRQWEAITNLSPKQVAEQLTRQVKNYLSFVLYM